MTRKRFIKLLMSHGYSRNNANEWAWNAYYKGWSYEDCYRYMKTTYLIHEIDWKMRKAIKLGMRKLKRMANDIRKCAKLQHFSNPEAYLDNVYITKT